ncbi:carbohydrate binding domain-containing protein [Cohnella cholangitidis]|uniref:Alpha-amylase n=1 Tax=Cohnella cholangitidis TaxID=2598458 RepID=A0A7G5C3Z8_9BACL|nr:carbohydrate binding domain-containing protein [Cohnella cholangitidis]QMV43932.1 alpha-amylase [Cohnella cholangitidis]
MKTMFKMKWLSKTMAVLLGATWLLQANASGVSAEIAAAHVYHNHMPNFWAYYDVNQYGSTPVGSPIRYAYDGDVIALKQNPPQGYPYYLPNGAIMPHDDLVSYYSHHAKKGAYLSWPWNVATDLRNNHSQAQMHVTMSGAVVNNVNSIIQRGNVSDYNNPNWGQPWRNAYNNLLTTNGKKTLDLIHFTGHHTMGPLAGNDYMLKDLIYQGATLAQPYFMGNSYKSSKGFFPTELGFSERIIPVLQKLGIQWSVIGNNHFSRTLRDYPLLNSPGTDTMVSPPNRADLQNTSNVGSWVSQNMFNEQQVVHNKYPFASTPHWVRYVDPATGQESKVVGIPVAQAESWEEGYNGSTKATALKPFEGISSQKQFFVVAHDGDNNMGRAGSEETWRNAGNVTYTDTGVKGMGIDEYLRTNLPAANDVVHVQDGSWIDTRDSSSDPTWYHWHLPFGIWKSQFSSFNQVNQTSFAPKKNLSGIDDGMTVSFEYGYHYLERNFALLQAALNYAKTAEQIWLEEHPNYWQPTTALDNEVTYPGNQLNPWMLSFPVKGNAANDYAGGANPAELAWYFLLPAMDSGFGYYDENVDDNVKPTLSFNQSLFFSKPYVQAKLAKDKVGPSVWWPQRYPYNPGSANISKAEGWTLHHFNNSFAIYTYAYDTSGIQDIKVKVRAHTSKVADASDNTFKVYDPAALQAAGVPGIDTSKVGAWTEYPMNARDLTPDINGVDWQPSGKAVMAKVPAQEIGNLYYSYINDYRDQLLDYYIEATDSKGNVTRSEIQQVYVGAGKYNLVGGKYVEDVQGSITGTHPFITDQPVIPDDEAPSVPTQVSAQTINASSIQVSWSPSTDNVGVTGYEVYRNGTKVGTTANASYTDNGLAGSTTYSYTVKAYDAKGNRSDFSTPPATATTPQGNNVTIYYKQGFTTPYIHYRPVGGTWTTSPGAAIPASELPGYHKITINIGAATQLEACFNNGSGTWDSNNSQNYLFGTGTWTYTPTGNIVAGAPIVDTEAPSVPQNVTAQASSASSASVSWSASTDNVGVTGYEVFRNGAKVGSTTGATAYSDSGLTGGTTYSYTVKAFDAAGNRSAISDPPATVTTPAGNSVTIYYKKGFTTPYIHYRPAGGVWTTSPGVAIPASEVPGYNKITINIGSASQLEACFNNGSGTWDSNNSQNYLFGTGTWTYTPTGNIVSGPPSLPENEPPTVPQNVAATALSATSANVTWSASTDNVGVTGYEVFRDGTLVGTTAATTYTNTGLAPSTTYNYTVKAYDAVGNKSAASTPAASVTTLAGGGNNVTIYYKNSSFANSYIHYKLDNATTWTALPGSQMQTSAYPGYASITIDLGSATGLTAAFNNGSGAWDSNGGNNYSFASGTWSLVNGNKTSGTPQADGVTFRVTVPSSTPANGPVYLTGSFNSWNAADSAYQLTKGTDGVYSITLSLPAGTAVQYKLTRGTWASVEANSNGSDIANRTLTPAGGAQTVNLTVQRWKDQ